MVFNVPYYYEQGYLPTSRHRVIRNREVKSNMSVEVLEPNEQQFPIAFIVSDYEYYTEEDGRAPDLELHSIEVRAYNNALWRAVRYSDCVYRKAGWMPIDLIAWKLEGKQGLYSCNDKYSNRSIIKCDNRAERESEIRMKAMDYLIFDGKVWCKCGEPMYCINTFGLGHNHGGTGFFIEYHYNSNIPAKNYFNALNRDKAIAYGKETAIRRGDTNYVDIIDQTKLMIQVLMPEMVKRNPAKDHGDGDPFVNSIEGIVENSDSVMEAGLLTIMSCMNVH